MRALIGFLPVALERWIRAALGPLPIDVAPWVALGAVVLAVAPLLSAGAEKEIQVVSSSEMVDRNVPTTVTYVSMPGLAMSVPLPAPGDEDAPPYGVIVRDTLAADALTVVMSPTDPLQLRSRSITARLQSPDYAEAAAAAFTARGDATRGLTPGLVLLEVDPPDDEPITDVTSASGLTELPNEILVRMPLRFEGESQATCAVRAAGCDQRLLAGGAGIFVQLAHDQDGQAVMVQTPTPAGVVAGQWQGTQVRNEDDLEDFAGSLPVQGLASWGRMLTLASIQDDPNLDRQRFWLGPVLLVAVAALLWLGGRIGYPFFRPAVEGGRGWAQPPGRELGSDAASTDAGEMTVRVSGHAITTTGQRRHLDATAARLVPAAEAGDDGRMTAALVFADGGRVALAAHDTGVLGSLERGEVVSMSAVRPALWAHWYGTDLRLVFASSAERDRAAELVGERDPSVRSRS